MDRVECYRAASVAFNKFACGGKQGLPKTSTIYQRIVEKRDVPATYETYSSCADRAHAWLWAIGCDKPFVNREERSPLPHDWHIGANISMLHNISMGSPCLHTVSTKGERLASPPGVNWVPEVGDELLIWNHPLGKDAHSLAIVAFDGVVAQTANYGASGMSAAVFPGAKIGEAPLTLRYGKWIYEAPGHPRQVQRVLRLVDYIEILGRKANLEGIPFDDQYIGEVRDLIEQERA